MYVFLCQGITDKDIVNAINEGGSDYKEVRQVLNMANQCGKCGVLAKQIVKETLMTSQISKPAVMQFNPTNMSIY